MPDAGSPSRSSAEDLCSLRDTIGIDISVPRNKRVQPKDFMTIGKKQHSQAGQQAAPPALLKPTAEQKLLPGSVEKTWDKAGTPSVPVLQWVKDRSIFLFLLQLLKPKISCFKAES